MTNALACRDGSWQLAVARLFLGATSASLRLISAKKAFTAEMQRPQRTRRVLSSDRLYGIVNFLVGRQK
jgi:hypothetical protein